MNDAVSALFTAFNRFVLRDVLGKMVPGGILLTGLTIAIAGDIRSEALSESTHTVPDRDIRSSEAIAVVGKIMLDPPTPIVLLLVFSTWVLGFAVQEIGSCLGLLKTEATRLPACTKTQKDRVKSAVRRTLARCGYGEQQAALVERHVVIKEASGNAGVAILLSGIAVVVGQYSPLDRTLPMLLAPIVVALILRHHRNRIIQHFMDELITDARKGANKNEPASNGAKGQARG